MDIIDIMLARALTPQGQTDTYVSKANAAAAKAEKAKQDAEDAVATVNAAAEDIADTQSAATQLLEDAQAALEAAQAAQGDAVVLPESYTTTGQNEDGYMTQKAVTDALASKADTSALAGKMDSFNLSDYASKAYVTEQIAAIPASEGGSASNINLGVNNAGKIVVVDSNGLSAAGTITEAAIIEALIKSGSYTAEGVVGLEIDYENKSVMRLQEAYGKTAGSDFNSYKMYGGRMRCNVADDGTINAFYGDPSYKDDGSNGEVMVYQPKFYYERIPLKIEAGVNGTIIRKETLLLSSEPKTGFKLHPLFKDGNNELDYVLISAYEGAIDNSKLVSRAGKKPISNMTLADMGTAAQAHGTGWNTMNMAIESAIQMLGIVEFGTMNGQVAIEKGVSNITSVGNYNCSSLTGSTASLGNTSGAASETINEINGTETTYNVNGKRAISYRGMENPWGNIWCMIRDMKVVGSNENNAGIPYILNGESYESIGFKLPSSYGYISAMGYGNKDYDWIYMPIECSNANSAAPVGDNIWTQPSLNGDALLAVGGSWGFEDGNGFFSYASDQLTSASSQKSYSTRLMFIPTKNNIYNDNIAAWTAKMEG